MEIEKKKQPILPAYVLTIIPCQEFNYILTNNAIQSSEQRTIKKLAVCQDMNERQGCH